MNSKEVLTITAITTINRENDNNNNIHLLQRTHIKRTLKRM
jgi:hypothetical protein